MPTRHGYMIKQPDEILDRAVDFSQRLLASSTIEVGSVTVIEAGSALVSLEPEEIEEGADVTEDMLSDDPEPFVPQDTKRIQFRVQGGESGKRYKVEIAAEGDDGQVAEYDVFVDVHDGIQAVGSGS